MCNSDSGIGAGIGIPVIIPGLMELESELNRRLKSHGGIGIELKGFGPESELNWNRPLPELHITGLLETNHVSAGSAL